MIVRPDLREVLAYGRGGQTWREAAYYRRHSSRDRRNAGRQLSWAPNSLSGLQVWVRGDGGRSLNTGTNPYQIASYDNKGAIGGVVSQSTPADQPLLATTGGRTANYADGACSMQSDQAATNFKFMHDGSGCTIMFVAEVTAGTNNAFATSQSTGTGAYLFSSSGTTINWNVRNAGTAAVNVTRPAAVGLHIVTIQLDASSYSLQVDDDTPITGVPGALSSSDPTFTLVTHAQTIAKAFPWIGAFPEFFAVNRVLTAPEIAQAKAYLTDRWLQDWSEAATPWPQMWLDASDTSSITVTGSGISDWASKSGIQIVGKQATDSKRPPYTSGQYADADGTDDFLDFTGFHQAAGKRTIVAVCQPDAAVGYLLDSQTGRFIIAPSLSALVGHYDGAWKQTGAWSSAKQVLAWQLDHATTSTHRRDGISLGTVTYTDVAMAGSQALFALYTGGGTWFNGKLHELLIFQPALTLTQLQAVEAYLQAKWGTP